jgi:mucolipin 2
VSVFGNFIQIVSAVIAIIDSVSDIDLLVFRFEEGLIGLGCMVSWLMMLKYLEYNPNINLMTSTLRLASSNLLMFMLGVLPFFFGFVFLGQCLFWRYDKFSSTLNSILTLFSLANGDIVSGIHYINIHPIRHLQ